jgi:hypothetical protein
MRYQSHCQFASSKARFFGAPAPWPKIFAVPRANGAGVTMFGTDACLGGRGQRLFLHSCSSLVSAFALGKLFDALGRSCEPRRYQYARMIRRAAWV